VPILIFLHAFIIYDLFIYDFPPAGKASADRKRKKRKKKVEFKHI
jgi:hypothetical protein